MCLPASAVDHRFRTHPPLLAPSPPSFACCRNPDAATIARLAKQCRESQRRVKVFFLNRRAKEPSRARAPPSKRVRTFDPATKEFLLAEYEKDPKPSTAKLKEIAAQVNEEFTRVRAFFNNRRFLDPTVKCSSRRQMSRDVSDMRRSWRARNCPHILTARRSLNCRRGPFLSARFWRTHARAQAG